MYRKYILAGVLLVAFFGFFGCKGDQVEPKTAFADLPFKEQHAIIMVNLQTVKQDLSTKGEYTCCTMPTCNWCLMNDKHCNCQKHLEKDEPVCNECLVGWRLGRGIVPGVEPENVRSLLSMQQ